MNYGQKIADLRKSKRLTQAELGAKLNITAQAVSKWENNLSEPDIESIRKMCELFDVSVDEFLGLSSAKAETQNVSEVATTKIINGYCEKCKKPVGPGEYTVSRLTYNHSKLVDKVQQSDVQHIYCNACNKEILELQKKEERQRELNKLAQQKTKNRQTLSLGLIWGAVVCVIVTALSLTAYFSKPEPYTLLGTIVCIIGSFTLTSQMFWDCFVNDLFSFFCRSFRAPFGLIFELSLDGILWLITVKFALWVICGLLSIAFFLVGLFLSLVVSIFSFPFILPMAIRGNLFD